MSNPESVVFPRVYLEHESIESSIAIIGLVHVVPRSYVGMYHEVGSLTEERLRLPKSVVHYELTDDLHCEGEQEIINTNPDLQAKVLQLETIDDKLTDLLGCAFQLDELYEPYMTDKWINHDLKDIDWVGQLTTSEIDEEIAATQQHYDYYAKFIESERNRRAEKDFLSDMQELASLQDKSDFDLRREEVAVTAVLRELKLGMRHFTMLWGLTHMKGLKAAFELQGYKPVATT